MNTNNEEQLPIDNGTNIENDLILRSLVDQAEIKAEEAAKRRAKIDNEQFALGNNRIVSVTSRVKEYEVYISSNLQEYPPKFSEFFTALGDLLNWTAEERKQFHKSKIAPDTINEVIYGRFSPEVLTHLQTINKFTNGYFRKHKHYKFLTPAGILELESYLNDAVEAMRDAQNDYYQFRVLMYERHQVAYQSRL